MPARNSGRPSPAWPAHPRIGPRAGRAPGARKDYAAGSMRFDVLLFELRLFKSRTQATAAIHAGHALLNGARSKPGRETRAGDHVTLALGGRPRTLEVLELPRGALSKEAARALVREVPAS